jgi:hypothetical protein
MPGKNLQPTSEPYTEQLADLPDQPVYYEDVLSEGISDSEFKLVTRSLSEISIHERLLKPAPKEQIVRQKIPEVRVQRRAAGDPTVSIRQANRNRRR